MLQNPDVMYHAHPQTNLREHQDVGPISIARGDGVHVIDNQGARFLDAVSGLWCASLGYSEQRLAEAAYRQMQQLPFFHTFYRFANNPVTELSEALIAAAPRGLSKVLFQSSGSEANDTAIKLIWYFNNVCGNSRRKKIISHNGSYHGNTLASVSMSGRPIMHRHFDVLTDRFIHVGCPHFYRYAVPRETEEEFACRLVNELEQRILLEDPETIAAFIAEPVLGAGGAVPPPNGYFEKVQAVLKRYGILFVVDEVICGFGRTGAFWGSNTYNLSPDILTCAKALSGAYFPISACLISQEIYDALVDGSDEVGTFAHGYTYAGHPVGAAVALEALRIYQEGGLFRSIPLRAESFQSRLRMLKEHPLVGEVTGVGLLCGLEIVADKRTRANFPPEAGATTRIELAARRRGLIVRRAGERIALAPPLIIESDHIEFIAETLGAALDDAMEELKQQ